MAGQDCHFHIQRIAYYYSSPSTFFLNLLMRKMPMLMISQKEVSIFEFKKQSSLSNKKHFFKALHL